MTVVLGFDFGLKHIGVAVGQSITQSATPISQLKAQDGIPDWDSIQVLIEQWRPHALIVGLPLNMDGSEQLMTFATKRFINRLKERFGLPVHAVDERLSSWEAKMLIPLKERNKKNKPLSIHAYAAALLVAQWLGSQH